MVERSIQILLGSIEKSEKIVR